MAHRAVSSSWMAKAVLSSAAATSTTARPGTATCASLTCLTHSTTSRRPQKFSGRGVFTPTG
ncbi:hypothetical protein ABZ619_41155 [Streptomyces sp. NPDC007851]|uniref:hypothetical protein n=1 Tax=Streptomyces sp. NPDC007851 TaxID=3155008 RepID=UPI0033FDFFC9